MSCPVTHTNYCSTHPGYVPGLPARTYSSDNNMSAGKLIKDTHINELSTAINEEATRRGINLTRVRPNVPNGGDVDNMHMRQLRDAIDEILPITQLHSLLTDANLENGDNIYASAVVALRNHLDYRRSLCVCDCAHGCTCECANACSCDGFQACTCNGHTPCTCDSVYTSDERLKYDIEEL